MAENEMIQETNVKPKSADEMFEEVFSNRFYWELEHNFILEVYVKHAWKIIFKSLKREENKKLLLHYIWEGIYNCWPSIAFERIQALLPYFMHIMEKGVLEDTMEAIRYFLDEQSRDYKEQTEKKRREQTSNATNAHKEQKLLVPTVLIRFIYEIESKWHPADSGNESKDIRRSKISLNGAVRLVFEQNKDEIKKTLYEAIQKIEEERMDENFEKWFSHLNKARRCEILSKELTAIENGKGKEVLRNAYNNANDFWRENNDNKTLSGSESEKRSRRTEESRRKSSEGQRKRWKERKEHGK